MAKLVILLEHKSYCDKCNNYRNISLSHFLDQHCYCAIRFNKLKRIMKLNEIELLTYLCQDESMLNCGYNSLDIYDREYYKCEKLVNEFKPNIYTDKKPNPYIVFYNDVLNKHYNCPYYDEKLIYKIIDFFKF